MHFLPIFCFRFFEPSCSASAPARGSKLRASPPPPLTSPAVNPPRCIMLQGLGTWRFANFWCKSKRMWPRKQGSILCSARELAFELSPTRCAAGTAALPSNGPSTATTPTWSPSCAASAPRSERFTFALYIVSFSSSMHPPPCVPFDFNETNSFALIQP